MTLRSDLATLASVTESGLRFRVPIYQRLFVWGHDQVGTLLEDLWSAFEAGADLFYLGTTLVIERDGGATLELVDGQQRFTVLWMMSIAWGGALAPFRRLGDGRSRVTFAIRPEVDGFFEGLLAGRDDPLGVDPIDHAFAQIRSFAARPGVRDRAEAFQRFVYARVRFVLTRVPATTDLNRLYEVINSRGQQLRHHEILKARLLGRLPAADRPGYARLWEAAAEMGTWVERSLQAVSGLRLRALVPVDDAVDRDRVLPSAPALLALVREAASAEGELRDLATLLAPVADAGPTPPPRAAPGTAAEVEEIEEAEVRSILSFPLLLQHVLRIWRHARGLSDLPRIADRDLLALFSSHFLPGAGADEVRSFVELLWEIRYVFDEHVVKWVRVGDDEILSVARIHVEEDRRRGTTTTRIFRRLPAEADALTHLQCMLYHSQQITTQYWLTPFLAYLWRHRPGRAGALAWLRHLDNHLLCSTEPSGLVERSAAFLGDAPGAWHRAPLSCSVLGEARGVGFAHYWFYKLEFLLWDRWADRFDAEQIRTFRITARNSVEHVSPRQPRAEDVNRVSPAVLDRFGNLALVSRGLNSEYGNLPFNEKRQRFQNRNRARVDSLKMSLIYRQPRWGDRLALQHEAEVVTLIAGYLGEDFARGGGMPG